MPYRSTNELFSEKELNLQSKRREKLKQAVDEYKDANAKKSIAAFANHYDLNESFIRQVLGGHKTIGEKASRSIEKALGKPKGWLDHYGENESDIHETLISEILELDESALAQVRAFILGLKSATDTRDKS